MVGGAEGRVVVYCPGQSVGERLQRIVQQPHEGGVCGSLLEAKVLGAEYQRYWNQERLHSGIGYKTPAEFAAELGPDSATLRPPQVRSQNQPTLISTGT